MVVGEDHWDIRLWPDVEAQILALTDTDPDLCDEITARIDMLAAHGPTLGRPIVDRVKGSSIHNMKQLRADSIRILFVFDEKSRGILLVMGDKRGDRKGWYPPAIETAKRRFREWQSGDDDD